MTEQAKQKPTVFARQRAALPERDDEENFQALLAQARHIKGRSYETTLYDHMQAFRLLWRHLAETGHLQRVHDGAEARLEHGDLTPAEASDLLLFLTVYATVRGG